MSVSFMAYKDVCVHWDILSLGVSVGKNRLRLRFDDDAGNG